jgi:hypothetical protein
MKDESTLALATCFLGMTFFGFKHYARPILAAQMLEMVFLTFFIIGIATLAVKRAE